MLGVSLGEMEVDEDGECSDDDNDDDKLYSLLTPGVSRVTDVNDITDQPCTIAFQSCLEVLADYAPRSPCGTCRKPYIVHYSQKGTAMYMTWVCIK